MRYGKKISNVEVRGNTKKNLCERIIMGNTDKELTKKP